MMKERRALPPTDEEKLFEIWFQRYRAEHWITSRPDRAHEGPSQAFCMGLREHFLEGWLARARLDERPPP